MIYDMLQVIASDHDWEFTHFAAAPQFESPEAIHISKGDDKVVIEIERGWYKVLVWRDVMVRKIDHYTDEETAARAVEAAINEGKQ